MGRPTPLLETAYKEQLGLYLNTSSRTQQRWIGAEHCGSIPLPSVTTALFLSQERYLGGEQRAGDWWAHREEPGVILAA